MLTLGPLDFEVELDILLSLVEDVVLEVVVVNVGTKSLLALGELLR